MYRDMSLTPGQRTSPTDCLPAIVKPSSLVSSSCMQQAPASCQCKQGCCWWQLLQWQGLWGSMPKTLQRDGWVCQRCSVTGTADSKEAFTQSCKEFTKRSQSVISRLQTNYNVVENRWIKEHKAVFQHLRLPNDISEKIGTKAVFVF